MRGNQSALDLPHNLECALLSDFLAAECVGRIATLARRVRDRAARRDESLPLVRPEVGVVTHTERDVELVACVVRYRVREARDCRKESIPRRARLELAGLIFPARRFLARHLLPTLAPDARHVALGGCGALHEPRFDARTCSASTLARCSHRSASLTALACAADSAPSSARLRGEVLRCQRLLTPRCAIPK